MFFRRCLLLLAASYVTFSSAMPVPDVDEESSLTMRGLFEGDLANVLLMARALPVAIANKMVNAQSKRVAAKATKSATNAAHPGTAKEKNQAIRTAQSAAKATRQAKWDSKKQAKPQSPTKPPKPARQIRPAKAAKQVERKAAGKELKAAGDRMKKTENLPDRKTTLTVGKESRSGRDVRQAVVLSHLNENNKISYNNKGNGYPKVIKPHPDPNYVKNTQAKGQYVLPKEGLQEYPIAEGTGWTGGNPHGMRALTSKNGGKDRLEAVVGHGNSKGQFEAKTS